MAATLFSTSITTHLAKKAGSGEGVEALQLGARVRYAEFSYTIAASLATSSVIALTVLPKGARIVGLVHQVSVSTGTMQLAFGLEDADGGSTYSTALRAAAVYTSVGSANATTTAFPVSSGAPLPKFTEDVFVTATTSVAVAPNATVLSGYVLYVDQMG